MRCTASPVDDWPDQLSMRDTRVLCEGVRHDITIEVQGINRIRFSQISDLSMIVAIFRSNQDETALQQPISLATAEYNSNVIEFFMVDADGNRARDFRRMFVWTRESFPTGPDRLRDTVAVYGASQTIMCNYRLIEGEVGFPVDCMAPRTVVVCDDFHNQLSGQRGQVRYPVLHARSHGPEASAAMLANFEPIAQILEDMQTEILTETCGD
jgi:hypothetical protein